MLELMIGMTIMAVVCGAFAGLLRYVMLSSTKLSNQSQAQEQARLGLMRLEERLSHANRIQTASATYVQYIVDSDQSPNYDPDADWDGDGVANYRDADRDNDAQLLAAATAQWQVGFNLKDDDENGDGKIDVRERIYLSSQTLWWELSLDEGGWTRKKQFAVKVSTLTFTYFGNKANPLGRLIDFNSDGVITLSEMDAAGNSNASLDTEAEQEYVTNIRVDIGVDWNKDVKVDYRIQSDVYPILLPLKPDSY